MSILADVFNYGGKLQKEPTYLERKYNEESSLARTQRRSKEGADAIRTTEADLQVAWKAKIGAAEGAELESLNAVDLNNPTISDYIAVYGYEKGGEIATKNTTIANAMLGDSDQFKKEFDWSLSKPILDESGKFTGQIDLPVRYTDLKTGESYTADLTTSGEKTSKVFQEQGQAGLDADKRTLDVGDLDEGYLLTRDAIFRQAGYDTSVSRLQGANQDIDNGIYTEAGPRKALFAQLDAQVPTEGAEGAEGAEEKTQTMAGESSSINLDSNIIDLMKSTPMAGLQIGKNADWANSYYTKGPAPFGLTLEEFNSDRFSDKERRQLQANENNLITKNMSKMFRDKIDNGIMKGSIPDAIRNFFNIPSDEKISVEDRNNLNGIREAYKHKGVLSTLKLGEVFKTNEKLRQEFENDPAAFALKYKDNPELIFGNDIDKKEGQKLVKQMSKEFDFSQAKVNALKTAITSGNQEAIVAAANAITNGKAPSNEVQTQIVNILTKAENNINLRGINKRINDRIVLGIIASDPQLLANNMKTIISFAQTGTLDFNTETDRMNAITSQRTADRNIRQDSLDLGEVGTMLSPLKIGESGYEFDPADATTVAKAGQLITNERQYNYWLTEANVLIKEIVKDKEKIPLLSQLLSLFRARGQGDAQMSLRPNIRYDSSRGGFQVMSPDGTQERDSFVSEAVIRDEYGPEALLLFKQAAAAYQKYGAKG